MYIPFLKRQTNDLGENLGTTIFDVIDQILKYAVSFSGNYRRP